MSPTPPGPVAVTGADGFIGHHVADVLRADEVEVITIGGPGGAGDGHTHRHADLRSAGEAARALEGSRSVVHLAARSGGIQLQRAGAADLYHDNVTMTRNVLAGAVDAGARRVFLASSAVVYSSRAVQHPLTESARTIAPDREEVDPYAWGKLTDEQLARWIVEAGELEVVVGRFDNVYGPGATFDPARSTVVQALVRKAVDAAPDGVLEVWGSGGAQRSFVHVRDAARAAVTVLAAGESGGVYNVSSTGAVTIADLARQLASAVSSELELAFRPDKPEGEPRRVLDAAALEELGFEPVVALTDGLREVVEHYRGLV